MPPRHAVACALALAACDPRPLAAPDASLGTEPDASAADAVPADAPADAGSVDAALPDAPGDAGPDAPPDAPADLTPPTLLAITPAQPAAIWLHDRVRLEFDEPLAPGAVATARVGSTELAMTVARDGDRTLVLDVDPAARATGTLELDVTGVRDLAANEAPPLALSYTLAPWHRPAVDRGVAASSPALAVDGERGVVAAWLVTPDAPRVVVARNAAGAWAPLGPALGAGASSVALALDASDRPVVAWIEGGNARVVRWQDGAWTPLPSPGTGSAIALAARGATLAAVSIDGGSAVVATLAGGDTWQPLGTLPLGGALAGAPAIDVPAAGEVAIAWLAGGDLHVARHAGAWTELAPLAVGPTAAHVSLAARASTLVVAWDQRAGSSGVYAARATASGWTRLGRVLDVDAAGEASAPAIALDGTTPVIAWRERIETAERGIVARFASGAWKLVGGHSFVDAGSAPPSPPVLALAPGGAPVVGWAAGGDVRIARFNGPRQPPVGLAARASLAGCTFSAASPPARVLETGCFTLPAAGKPAPHAGLVPYDLVTELWSDGTKKRRWIALPGAASMTLGANGAWQAPEGTFLVKEFAIETTPGVPATRRAIETRFLVNTGAGWQGFTYRWRADGSNAELLTDGTFTADWALDDGGTYRHYYPSRSACRSCHHGSQGPLLGLRPAQLQRWFDYDGVIADQLATLAALDVGPASAVEPLASPHDGSASLETRVRGYMAANCAHCHNPQHVAIKDLRSTTPLAQTRLCEVIVPGDPGASRLYQLVSQRPGMPALGTLQVDPLAEELTRRWITTLTSCP